MSDALRLADELSTDYYDDVRVTAAANELRRLHALNAELIEQAVKAEREACAKVCDEIDRRWINQADKCAAAIRGRT